MSNVQGRIRHDRWRGRLHPPDEPIQPIVAAMPAARMSGAARLSIADSELKPSIDCGKLGRANERSIS